MKKLRLNKRFRNKQLSYIFAVGIAGLVIGLLPFMGATWAAWLGGFLLVVFVLGLIFTEEA